MVTFECIGRGSLQCPPGSVKACNATQVSAADHLGWDSYYRGDYFQRSINRTYRIQSDAAVTRQSRTDAIEFLTLLIGPFGSPASR
jgi:hypothetical protein